MKPEELMIGDIVLYENKPYFIRELGIFGVNRDGNDYPAVCIGKKNGIGLIVERNEINPIPLTPEILEKNGWEYNNYNNETEYDEEYYVDENGFDVHINGEGFEVRCIDAINIQLKYLHELQHVLRLCGIEKTIEL